MKMVNLGRISGILILALGGTACREGPAPDARRVPAEVPFKLAVGKQALLGDAGYRLMLRELVGDSRCARGVMCVWAGDSAVRLFVEGQGMRQDVVLHTSGRDGMPNTAVVFSHRLRLVDLHPYPVYEKEVDPQSYVATLTWSPE